MATKVNSCLCGLHCHETFFLGTHFSVDVYWVEEPSKYGVVITEEATGRVERFVEKPETSVGDKVNAGILPVGALHSVHDRILLKPTLFEKKVFPLSF